MKTFVTFLCIIAIAMGLCSCGGTASDEPFALTCAGEYLYWDACEDAVEYDVYLDGEMAATVTECAYAAGNEFSSAEIIARKSNGKEQKSTRLNRNKASHGSALTVKTEAELSSAALSSCAELTIDTTEGLDLSGKDLTIPKNVKRVNIISDGASVYSSLKIYAEARTTDLTLSLKNFSASGRAGTNLIEMRSAEGYEPTLVIECSGVCSLSGGNGKNGADGADGAMLQHGANGERGGDGAAAISAQRVFIAGDGRLALTGGSGGNGGKGGLGNGINNPGNGGNGGNGGNAISTGELTVYMKQGASCYLLGGSGGTGGDGGDKYSSSFGSSHSGDGGAAGAKTSAEARIIRGVLR